MMRNHLHALAAAARVADAAARHVPARRRPALATALMLSGLWGCSAPDGSRDAAPRAPVAAVAPAAQIMPAGAVAVGDDLYQVPVGSDADGCLMYRLYSPTRMVSLAISYRAADGSFTMDHRRAVCDPDLFRRR